MIRYSVNVIVLCQTLTCLFCLNRKAFLASCSQALTFCALAPIMTHSKVKLLVLLSAGCKENQFSGLLFEHSATMIPTSLKLILINLHTQFSCSWCKWRTESTRLTEKSSCSRTLQAIRNNLSKYQIGITKPESVLVVRVHLPSSADNDVYPGCLHACGSFWDVQIPKSFQRGMGECCAIKVTFGKLWGDQQWSTFQQ